MTDKTFQKVLKMIDLFNYSAVADLDSWKFTDEQLDRAESYDVVTSEEGYLYLTIYDINDEFIAEIEFSPEEIHTMQAYINEFFDEDYQDEIYNPDWNELAYRVSNIADNMQSGISAGVINNALD